jgi:polyisoprenoid-binding protein YceI
MRLACLAAAAAAVLAAAPTLAQQPRPGDAPRPAIRATKDAAAAPAGTYEMARSHIALIVKVAHAGFSASVFRMNGVSGALTWDPAKLETSKVTTTVAANSLDTYVPGFAETLTGPLWLDAARFPTITFTSTSIQRTGPTTGLITGDLTLHGVTRPVVLRAELTGAGQGPNAPTLGFTAKAMVRRSDFGVGPASQIVGDEMEVDVDLEFVKIA